MRRADWLRACALARSRSNRATTLGWYDFLVAAGRMTALWPVSKRD
jgi:hypothetical protein